MSFVLTSTDRPKRRYPMGRVPWGPLGWDLLASFGAFPPESDWKRRCDTLNPNVKSRTGRTITVNCRVLLLESKYGSDMLRPNYVSSSSSKALHQNPSLPTILFLASFSHPRQHCSVMGHGTHGTIMFSSALFTSLSFIPWHTLACFHKAPRVSNQKLHSDSGTRTWMGVLETYFSLQLGEGIPLPC